LILITTESAIRLGIFATVLILMGLAEVRIPRRHSAVAKPLRWASNLGLICLNTVAVRLFVPLGIVGVALAAQERSWGLLNNWSLPGWLAVAISVIALDFVIYLQHFL